MMNTPPDDDFLGHPPEALRDRPLGRVVSLVPSMTETLFDLNLGGRVVGVTEYCIHPAEKLAGLPRIGGTKNPDIDAITALAPDVVIANREENRREDVLALRERGIIVWVTHPRTVPDAFNLLWLVMDTFNETSMVDRVRLIERQYDWVRGMSQQREERGGLLRVFCPIWSEPWMTFNADTYAHDLLRVCGGLNVFAERERQYPLAADLGQAEPLPADDVRVAGRDTRYPRLTEQEIIDARPDVVLLPSEPFAFSEAHIPLFKALDIPAAHHDRIHPVDGSLLTWHGTRIAYALETLPALLYPPEEV